MATKKQLEVGAKGKTGPKPIKKEKLDHIGIDAICAKLLDGMTMTAIADETGISFGTLQSWIDNNYERSARVKEARVKAARYWDEKATRVIEAAEDNFGLAKARELAHHYRWRAAKIAPREYGDKLAVGGADDLPSIKADLSISPDEAYKRMLNGQLPKK